MAKFKPEYTAEDIMSMYRLRSAEGDELRIRTLAEQFRALTRLEHVVNIPKQYQAITSEVRTPFLRDAWHRITSSLCGKPPVEHVTPKDDKREDYRDAANIAERFDLAMIERFNKELGTDLIFALTSQLVRDGESVLKVVHRPTAWANFPKRASDELPGDYNKRAEEYKHGADLPIAWRDVDRLSIVPEKGEYGDEWIMEYGEFAKPYLRTRYHMVDWNGRLVDPKHALEGKPYPEGMQPANNGRSTRLEFFTAREWHVLIDGVEAPKWPKPNPYAPHLPYFRAPALDGESLLYSLLFLVPRLDELLTMKLNWSYLGAYPNPVLETVPNSNAFPGLDGPVGNPGDIAVQGVKPLTWTPGKLMDLPLGRKLSFLAPPPVGKDLNDLVLIFKSLIDVAGIPSIMRGVSGAGDSGYLANQLRAGAEMAYKLAALSAQRQLEKAVEFSHWIISNIVQQTVYVLGWDSINPKTGRPREKASQGWIALSPDASGQNIAPINKLGPVSFAYRTMLATDQQAAAMIAMQLTNSPNKLYDRRHALENFLQEEDAESILDAIWLEEAEQAPEIRGPLLQRALEEAGMLPPARPNPASALVGPNGMPLLPPGPNDLQGVPLANQAPPGMAGVPGLTMPIAPTAPQGIPGNTGGRPSGAYPGQPGGPNR